MIYIARHGRTAWTGLRYCGRSDPPLDRQGRRDAERLRRELAPTVLGRARVVSSPLRRARQTAAHLAGAAGFSTDDRLIECDLGMIDGLTYADLAERWPALAAALLRGDDRLDWPGGEAWSSVRDRVRSFCAELTRATDVIVVTHGFIARALARELGTEIPFLGPARIAAVAR